MNHFNYKKNKMYCEGVSLEAIARKVGTPAYVYSHATLKRHFEVFDKAFAGVPHLICFAMKANSNIAVLSALAKLGSGADIVSGGELFRALKAGVPANRIVYSGVGKTPDEMKYALEEGILQFNVESEAELHVLDAVARSLKKKAPVSLRVNPDIDPKTHPYISTGLKKSKFGVPFSECLRIYESAKRLKGIEITGVSCHIGSQITTLKPFQEALAKVSGLVEKLRSRGFNIRRLDLGGGLGIPYEDESPPHPEQYGQSLMNGLKALDCQVVFEPGRLIVGNAGVFLTKVLYKKSHRGKEFVIIDGAMNDLIRPALYGSYHQIYPVRKARSVFKKVNVVGPVCESGDFLAEDRRLPVIESGDLLAVMSAGAYGFVMSSNYNSRPRVPEVLVHGKDVHVIRERESVMDLIRGEQIPEFLK
jgi:diaminopimelate decarboxylase